MTTTHEHPTADEVGRMLTRVSNEFNEALDAPVWSLESARLDERFAQAVAVRAAAEEVMARLAGEMTDRHHAEHLGASSTRAHLVGAHRMSHGEAAKVVKAAKLLHGNTARSALTEPVRRAQACGQVTAEQAVVIATAVDRIGADVPIDAVEAGQADLVRYARELPFEQLRQVANRLVEVIDPEGADKLLETQLRRQERDALAGCDLVMTVLPDGSSNGRWRHLPSVTSAILKKALDACAATRHLTGEGASDDAEPLDRRLDTSPAELPYPNRLGRAFGELIEHLPVDGLPQHGTSPVQIVVTVDEARLQQGHGSAVLDTGELISVGETRRMVCHAGILPMVLSGESKVLDLGRSRRLFDRYQRLALAQRDGGCVFPRCDRPPAWCEAHHLRPWSSGGPTDLDNGALLCSFHHHLIHNGEWQLRLALDGIPEAIPPPWVDPERRPIRHTRLKPRPG